MLYFFGDSFPRRCPESELVKPFGISGLSIWDRDFWSLLEFVGVEQKIVISPNLELSGYHVRDKIQGTPPQRTLFDQKQRFVIRQITSGSLSINSTEREQLLDLWIRQLRWILENYNATIAPLFGDFFSQFLPEHLSSPRSVDRLRVEFGDKVLPPFPLDSESRDLLGHPLHSSGYQYLLDWIVQNS